jgi:hypothetical protein
VASNATLVSMSPPPARTAVAARSPLPTDAQASQSVNAIR